VGVTVGEGASIGARAVCVAPVRIGAWATVAAGAVVTRDVPAHALVAGTPAVRVGWVGRAGRPLVAVGDDGGKQQEERPAPQARGSRGSRRWRCPVTGALYEEVEADLETAIREVRA